MDVFGLFAYLLAVYLPYIGIGVGVIGAIAGVVLLVLGLRNNGRRFLAAIGAFVVVASVLTAGIGYGTLPGDHYPDAVELDWREPITAASLPKDRVEIEPGRYQYFSALELTLPDGSVFTVDKANFYVHTTDGLVTLIDGNALPAPWPDATATARGWLDQLHTQPVGLGPDEEERTQSFSKDGVAVSLGLELHKSNTTDVPSNGVAEFTFRRSNGGL